MAGRGKRKGGTGNGFDDWVTTIFIDYIFKTIDNDYTS